MTPTTELEPNIDAYGSRARAGTLLDFAELRALAGTPATLEEIADYASDNSWLHKLDDLDIAPSPPQEDPDEAANESVGSKGDQRAHAVELMTHLISERAGALGDRYPFHLQRSHLESRESEQPLPYLVLLAITVAHAYRLDLRRGLDPREEFEELVARSLGTRFAQAVNFGSIARSMSFEEAVVEAGTRIGLRPTPRVGMRAAAANDEKVDAIAHVDWGDGRIGEWVVIGQATCAKSDEWDTKLGSPSPADWMNYLGLTFQPLAFLAVPHHVTPAYFQRLMSSRHRAVLDRLRLARRLPAVSAAESEILEAVRASPLVRI
jgi:hypothetical protein